MTDNAAYGTHYSDAENYVEDAHSLDFDNNQPRALAALGFAQVNAQLAIADALEKLADALTADRYAANEARQREEAQPKIGSADWVQQFNDSLDGMKPCEPCAPEPDPLDEDDHRDREKNGERLVRSFRGHWHTPDFDCRMYCRLMTDGATEFTLAAWNMDHGPLTFAPDAAQETPSVAISADEGAETQEPAPEADRPKLNAQTGVDAPQPDPLDEDDHRDRIDKDGDVVRRKGHERWAWPGGAGFDYENVGWPLNSINASDGPLTFAPDASPAPQDAAQDAAEGEGDAVEGGGSAGPPEALLCHECEHEIDEHTASCVVPRCSCNLWPTDIARHLIAQAARTGRERLEQEPDPEPVVLPEGWRLDNGHDLIRPGDPEGVRVGVVARDHRRWYAMSATTDDWRVCDTKQWAVDFLRAEAERKVTS